MATKFGEYTGTVAPRMTWYAEYSYTRTSNSVVQVTVTVVGDIINTASTSYMGAGANVVVTASAGGSSQTYEIKSSSDVWRGSDSTDPRSHTFTFNVSSTTAGTSIPVSYSVAGSSYTAAAKVPTQSTSFSSPALLYSASVPSMSAATMGTAVTISTNRENTSMVHTITYAFGSATGTIGTAKAIGASVSWTPALTLANQIPSSTKGTCTITCKTYVGDTLIGTESISVTLSVPASVVPTCSLATALVTNGEPSSWGVAVQGYTKVKCTATATGVYGSTIKSYKITGGGYSSSASTYTTGVMKASGSNTFTLTVTDSRGRTATATKSVTVYEYAPPKFSSPTVYRADSSGTKTSSGAYVYAKTSFSYSSVNGKNSATCTVAYRKNGATSYSGTTSLTSGTGVTIGGGAISSGSSYVVRFSLTDGIQTVTKDIPIGTVLRSFHIKKGGKGVAFGKVAETDNLIDSAWPVKAPTLQVIDIATTLANLGAAPSGYGLGAQSPTCSDCNLAVTNGWYRLSGSECLNYPEKYSNFKYGALLVLTRYTNATSTTVYQIAVYNLLFAVRQGDSATGEWGNWEYVNPPLASGAEYRTTERWMNEVVYVKLLNCGTAPNSTTKSVSISDASISVVSCNCFLAKDTTYSPLPSYDANVLRAYYWCSNSSLSIKTATDLSAYTCYAIVKYTKS